MADKEMSPPPPPNTRTGHQMRFRQTVVYLERYVRTRLWAKVLIGMVLGIATGIALGPWVGWVDPPTASTIGNWLALPGRLFLALVQMIVVPLVFASIIRGLAASGDLELLKSIGIRVVIYFVVTTAAAIVIGIALALLIEPGAYVDSELVREALGSVPQQVASAPGTIQISELPSKLVLLLPSNPLNSMVQNEMLQVVIFALVFGVALVMMAPVQSKPLLDLLQSLQQVCMTVVGWAMRLAPFAVFGLIAQLTAKIGLDALLGMAVYVGTVLLGLVVLLVMYLIIALLAAGLHPLQFLSRTKEVLLLAFSTSSSAAVMPFSMKTAEEKFDVRPSVSQFVIPLGATLNMNGTALYQGVAAIFLAQIFQVDLGLSSLILIVVTAVGASIGTPATPGVGIVILTMVLGAAGIPPAGIALIMGVDRILDMSRTAINVAGDILATVLMNRYVAPRMDSESGADLVDVTA